ncbi:MAG: hypothetical protein HY925_11165, partial [Elusimicrobia bacterium]|nr:hypothetical protein [Elusimicrobiota bacterium]
SPPIDDEQYFLNAASYIEYNPVSAGMVARPEDYPWSSCRGYRTGIDDNLTTASKLLAYVEKGGYESWLASASQTWPHKAAPEWFGFPERAPTVEQKDAALLALARNVVAGLGCTLESVLGKSRQREPAAARRKIAEQASNAGYTGAAIAQMLGRTEAAVSQMLAGRKLKVGV